MEDVIVIGAGPAGNNTALRLASLGYGVTVVDWRKRIGDKLCTGIVGAECARRFPIEDSMVYRQSRSASIILPRGKTVHFARQEVQAYVVDRVSYVASMATRAAGAGATYLLGQRVTDISFDGDHAKILLTDEAEPRTLKARAVVLASGFGSELTSQIGLGRVGDFVTGVQAEVMTCCMDELNIYVGRNTAPGFFAWLAPTSKDRALVGLLSRHHGQLHLERLIHSLQEQGNVTEVVKGPSRWGIPLRPLARTYRERLLVVGDVAGQVKPITGGGIYYALLASEIAADTLDKAFRRKDFSASQLRTYEQGWKSLLAQEIETGYSARRLFELLRDCHIDSLMRTITSNGIYSELSDSPTWSFDWHSGIIKKVLGHPLLGRTLSVVNPLLSRAASRS